MFISHEEVMARMSPERRAAIKKGAAKIKAEIDAAVETEEAKAVNAKAASASASVSSVGGQSSGMPMTAAAVAAGD